MKTRKLNHWNRIQKEASHACKTNNYAKWLGYDVTCAMLLMDYKKRTHTIKCTEIPNPPAHSTKH